MQGSGGSASGGLPQEIINIITEGWGETESLRRDLIGQFLGILRGEGPYEYMQTEGTPGYYEDQWVEVEQSGGEGPMLVNQPVWVEVLRLVLSGFQAVDQGHKSPSSLKPKQHSVALSPKDFRKPKPVSHNADSQAHHLVRISAHSN